ncbi:MAG TPA: rhodanese-like domain-containing protein, partial [Casimicrobiaceae bacterium]|nr:rhodanese-like domain-containing protein [Casimicrobiaceae bacterium]
MNATWSTLIDTDALAAHVADPAFVIVDVRHDLANPDDFGGTAYAQSHIPGARFAHVDRDLSARKTGRNGRHPLPSPELAAALFGRLGIDASKQVVAYDQGNGMFAARLWWMLRWLGHDSVAVLDGGFAKWQREGKPVSSDIPDVQPATFTPTR